MNKISVMMMIAGSAVIAIFLVILLGSIYKHVNLFGSYLLLESIFLLAIGILWILMGVAYERRQRRLYL
jgi:hypothetical protein